MSSLENSKKIIKTWIKKGDVERNKFSKFICYWIAFNCQLYTVTHKFMDGRALKKLYKKSVVDDKFKELVRGNKDFENKLKNLKKVCPIENERKKRKKRENNQKYIPKDISKIDNFKEVMNVIYEARCNLFHGSKSDEDSRDIEVIEAAVPVLEIIVKNIIKL